MSRTGMPSVTHTMRATPASSASRTASAANRAGTNTSAVFAPVRSTASATVSNTGTPSTSRPPFPGVTPATTCVPYARFRRAWKAPSLPVMPWTTRRVAPSIRIATSGRLPGSVRELDGLRRGLQHGGGRHDAGVRGLLQDAAALRRVRAVQADHDGDASVHPPQCLERALRDQLAAGDAAEDVDEHGPDLWIRQHDFERGGHHVRRRTPAHVQEVRGPAAGLRDHVERGHDKAGPVADDPDLAVELHVLQALLVRPGLGGIDREARPE